MTGLDEQDSIASPSFSVPFRELKAPAIPPAYRNHQPPELFAISMNSRRTSPWPNRPCMTLAPSKAANGRAKAAAKAKAKSTPRRVGANEEESE